MSQLYQLYAQPPVGASEPLPEPPEPPEPPEGVDPDLLAYVREAVDKGGRPRATADSSYATNFGDVTLLDIFEPVVDDDVFNIFVKGAEPHKIVLLPTMADVEQRVFAPGARYDCACTPDGRLHYRPPYSFDGCPEEEDEDEDEEGNPIPPVNRRTLRGPPPPGAQSVRPWVRMAKQAESSVTVHGWA
jgi:hypothetical protein